MGSTLEPGQTLRIGGALVSPSGAFRFIFQSDGNLVLTRSSDNFPIWSPGMHGQGGVRLEMQGDGNLVLYRADNFPIWQTGTNGRPGSHLVLQDDANLVVYERTTPYWESRTHGGVYHEEETWLEGAVKTVGQPFVVLAHTVGQGVEVLADAAGEIPLVGPALHGVLIIAGGPFKFTDQVLQGQRIDRALVQDLQDKISGVREVAPYAQTVVSFIPGIGQGVGAAIGAGLALAAGKPIDEALAAGVRSALPGGPIAAAAFDLTYAAATGQNIIDSAGKTAILALKLPPEAAQATMQAFNVVYRAAQGENIPLAVLDQARSYMPTPEAKKAFDVGLAVAHGQRLQDVAVKELSNLAPAQIEMIKSAAGPVIARSPVFQQVQNIIASPVVQSGYQQAQAIIANPIVQSGYQLGTGLMAHTGVTTQAIQAVRSHLPPDQQRGFDLGVIAWQGAMQRKPPPAVTTNPAVTAGYVMTKGLEKYPDQAFKKQVMARLAANPSTRIGAAYALKEIASKQNFFQWLWHLVAG